MNGNQTKGPLNQGRQQGREGQHESGAKTQGENFMDQGSAVMKAAYAQAKEGLSDAVGSDMVESATRAGERMYREGSQALSRQVAERPLMALLAAGVIGYLLALVLNRR